MTTATANGAPKKPATAKVQPERIAPSLKQGKRFVCWRWEHRGDKWTKPPYTPDGKLASTTDPKTWATFDECLTVYRAGRCDGIGRVLVREDGIVGFDLDKCINGGNIDPAALSIVQAVSGYAERSPSGRGIRILAYGAKPGKRCRIGAFEVYDSGRYLTLTGDLLDGSAEDVPDCQEGIEAGYNLIFPAQSNPKDKAESHRTPFNGRTPSSSCPLPLTDAEVSRWKCISADKQSRVIALCRGDISAWDNDDSRADAALARYLLIIANGERARAESLFGESTLGKRAKWTGRVDYRERTFDFAEEGFTPWNDDPGNRQTANDSGVPSGKPDSAAARSPASAALQDYLRETLDPVHRKDAKIYAAKLCRYVARSEFGPTDDAIARLAAQACPRDRKGNPDLDALPRLFREWAPVAWHTVYSQLPVEGADGQLVDGTATEFRTRLAALFSTMVRLDRTIDKGTTREKKQEETRPLMQWCDIFAKTGRWKDIRGRACWAKRDHESRLLVAFRAELISQLHAPGWGLISHDELSRLCRHYGYGRSVPVRGGDDRAIELSREFIDDRLDAPADDKTDTPTDAASRV